MQDFLTISKKEIGAVILNMVGNNWFESDIAAVTGKSRSGKPVQFGLNANDIRLIKLTLWYSQLYFNKDDNSSKFKMIEKFTRFGSLKNNGEPSNNYGGRQKLFIKLGEKCNKCGDKENLTIDHIEEFRKNGNNQLDNLQLLCVSCHLKKNLNLQLKIKERQLAQLKEKLASPNFLEDAKKHFINLRREDG